ncbi:Uncharacterised protein [Kluyvera cryocrescens]|uniref:Glutathione import ATP-binding protein GsiA n=1 Tax=Kluyvera cryocrescens TaxID=580 RepID=A0A485A2Y0_KLUCR|nr:Uncharacterised protein [Kluyvera cryocrescens]
MTEQRLSVQGLNIDYPGSRVVNNMSFTLGNERLALVGEIGLRQIHDRACVDGTGTSTGDCHG